MVKYLIFFQVWTFVETTKDFLHAKYLLIFQSSWPWKNTVKLLCGGKIKLFWEKEWFNNGWIKQIFEHFFMIENAFLSHFTFYKNLIYFVKARKFQIHYAPKGEWIIFCSFLLQKLSIIMSVYFKTTRMKSY